MVLSCHLVLVYYRHWQHACTVYMLCPLYSWYVVALSRVVKYCCWIFVKFFYRTVLRRRRDILPALSILSTLSALTRMGILEQEMWTCFLVSHQPVQQIGIFLILGPCVCTRIVAQRSGSCRIEAYVNGQLASPVLWHYWLVIWLVKIVPEMTYKVSSGTLNLDT